MLRGSVVRACVGGLHAADRGLLLAEAAERRSGRHRQHVQAATLRLPKFPEGLCVCERRRFKYGVNRQRLHELCALSW